MSGVCGMRSRCVNMRAEVDGGSEATLSNPLSPPPVPRSPIPSPSPAPRDGDPQAQWAREEQQMIIREQDQTISSIAGTLSTLAQQAGLMGQEIGEHNEMLDDLDRGVDRSESKLADAMKKMKKFMRDTEETKSGWCIVILIIILLALLMAVILV